MKTSWIITLSILGFLIFAAIVGSQLEDPDETVVNETVVDNSSVSEGNYIRE